MSVLLSRTAISRGDVFKGFVDGPKANTVNDRPPAMLNPISVVSSVARESIGLVVLKPFIEGTHHRKHRVFDEGMGIWMVNNQMRWLVKKGDQVQSDEAINYKCEASWASPSEYEGVQYLRFCHCEADKPPAEETSPLVTQLCELKCKLGVPYSSLDDYRPSPNWKWGKRAVFDVKMVLSGATVEFSAFYGGKLLKSEDVGIEYA